MDIYLPADFLEVRNTAAPDWRDARATFNDSDSGAESRRLETIVLDSANTCADPTWRVF